MKIDHKTIIKALEDYMEREGITQAELARRLGWLPSNVSNIFTKWHKLGYKRILHIQDKLGLQLIALPSIEKALKATKAWGTKLAMENAELKRKISHLTGEEKPPIIAERAHYGYNSEEREYIDKLVTIFRTKDPGTKIAIMQNIDTFLKVPAEKTEKVKKNQKAG